MTITLSILNRFKKNFTGRFLGKFAHKRVSKMPQHLAYVSTLPCETLMSAKEAINDKLATNFTTLPCTLSLMACFADINISQGSVAIYARCGVIVYIHLTANLTRNLPVKIFSKSVKN